MCAIRSMTGFGRGESTLGDSQLVAELRSVNHRHIEIRLHLDRQLALPPSFFEEPIRSALRRGRVSGSLELRTEGTKSPEDALREKVAPLIALRDELDPGGPFPWAAIPLLSTLAPEPTRDAESIERAATEALEAALRQLLEMRRFEGERLESELHRLLEHLGDKLSAVKARSPKAVLESQARLRERVCELLDGKDERLDPDRLENEIAYLADRTDIREEIARLEAHLDQFSELLGSTEPVGRRLDFLIQEMGREINTIGSKSSDLQISRKVVEMKATLEQLREQVQNIV